MTIDEIDDIKIFRHSIRCFIIGNFLIFKRKNEFLKDHQNDFVGA